METARSHTEAGFGKRHGIGIGGTAGGKGLGLGRGSLGGSHSDSFSRMPVRFALWRATFIKAISMTR